MCACVCKKSMIETTVSEVWYVKSSKENDARPPVPLSGSVGRASIRGTWRTRLEDKATQVRNKFNLGMNEVLN